MGFHHLTQFWRRGSHVATAASAAARLCAASAEVHKFKQIDLISISGLCIRFFVKICQTVRFRQFHEYLVVFHHLTQLWRRGRHVATAASAAARLCAASAEVRKLAIIDFRSTVKPLLVNPLLNYLRRAFFFPKKLPLTLVSE